MVIKSGGIMWVGHVACIRDIKDLYILVGKLEGKGLLKISRRSYEDVILVS
jgi:hypothetical protein